MEYEREAIVDGVILNLICQERKRTTRWVPEGEEDAPWNIDRANLYVETKELSGLKRVVNGEREKYPFVFKIPLSGRETYHGIDGHLEWFLYAEIISKERSWNQSSEYVEINIAKPSSSTKEVIREVVLVPCFYCHSLMPQAAIFCPNCGARRKSA